MLDTGNSSGILLPRNTVEWLGWLNKYPTTEVLISGAIGQSKAETFNLPEAKFGPYTLENVVITTPTKGGTLNLREAIDPKVGTRISKGKKVDGILGYDILKHFLVTIDYKKGYLHIGLPE